MGYQSTVQVIRRGRKNRQYDLICPAPLAQALEIEKEEVVEWVAEDKHTLTLKRLAGGARPPQRRGGPMRNKSSRGAARDVGRGEARDRSPHPARPDPETERGKAHLKRVNQGREALAAILASRHATIY